MMSALYNGASVRTDLGANRIFAHAHSRVKVTWVQVARYSLVELYTFEHA